MEDCPICSISLANFDDASRNHHVEACLDNGGPPAASATDASGHVATTGSCPICDASITINNLEDHVQACLAGSEQPVASTSGSGGEVESGCPCCFLSWSSMDVSEDGRTVHVTKCLAAQQALAGDDASSEEDEELVVLDEQGNKLSSSQLKALLSRDSLTNGFGKLSRAVKGKGRQQDPETPNLIPLLADLLEKSFASSHSATRSAVLCTPDVQHVRGQWADFGWGCGYRNAQMVFSALRHIEQYREIGRTGSNTPTPGPTTINGKRKTPDEDTECTSLPSILELQEIAEKAWRAGFDPEGMKHFKGKLVGSKRWIGTSEVYVMFTWLGIRVTVIDFPKSSGSRTTQQALTEWVFDYFQVDLPSSGNEKANAFDKLMTSGGSSIRIARDKMPLYLQHQGHSRTIVGVEVTESKDLNLILFDPGRKVPQDLRNAALSLGSAKKAKTGNVAAQVDFKLLEHFRVNLKSLSRRDEYQIMRIETEGGALDPDEKLQRRILRTLRVT